MNLVWVEDEAEVAECAAEAVLSLARARPEAVLALPTGQTPRRLYALLREEAVAGVLDASRLRIYGLDEFVGLGRDDPRSYAAYLEREVVSGLSIPPGHARLLDGLAPDPAAECAAHEASIRAAGGLDLAILGLGSNGHIAFNEPGADRDAPGRVVALSAATREDHRLKAAPLAPPPGSAMTIGLPLITGARGVLLLVSGAGKQDALGALVRGAYDPAWPVTALVGHPALTVIAPVALRTRP